MSDNDPRPAPGITDALEREALRARVGYAWLGGAWVPIVEPVASIRVGVAHERIDGRVMRLANGWDLIVYVRPEEESAARRDLYALIQSLDRPTKPRQT